MEMYRQPPVYPAPRRLRTLLPRPSWMPHPGYNLNTATMAPTSLPSDASVGRTEPLGGSFLELNSDIFAATAQISEPQIGANSSTSKQSSTPSDSTPTRDPFELRVAQVRTSKADINNVVLDYLIHQGYTEAAKHFRSEASIRFESQSDTEHIHERVGIRNAIHAGDIQSAIDKINDLNPQLLDEDSSLHFALLRMQLIELIRTWMDNPESDISIPLEFAQMHLAPRAPTDPDFLVELENTMALLIFPANNLTPELAELLDESQRHKIATRVNEAILASQGYRAQAMLKTLVKLRTWAEKKARLNKKSDLPTPLTFWTAGERVMDGEDSVMTGNGEGDGEAMAT